MNIPERPARNDAFDELVQAACGFARREIDRLADVVIDALRNLPPTGIFGDNLAPRHMWDEYCWDCQEGSFVVDLATDDWRAGTVSGKWETTIWTLVHGQVESLDRQIRVLLSAAVFEHKKEEEDDEWDGTIDIDLITSAVVEDIEDKVSSQNIDVIGPHRGEIVLSEITFFSKIAWIMSLFEDKINLIDTDTLLYRDADLNNMAEYIVEEFFHFAEKNRNEELFCEFISSFAPLIRNSIITDTK